MSDNDKTDVTDRATALGWRLPDGFRVLARLQDDSDIGHPREQGLTSDAHDDDTENPTRGFCKYCGAWIRLLDEAGAAEVNRAHLADVDGTPVAFPFDWVSGAAGIKCPEIHGTHELDEPLAVRRWREGVWWYSVLFVDVADVDEPGRKSFTWGMVTRDGLVEGAYPEVNPDTGAVTVTRADPMTDERLLDKAIGEALRDAQRALTRNGGKDSPVITGPPPAGATRDPNAAHAMLVGLVESTREMTRQGLPVPDGLATFAEHFGVLDDWLRKGGPAPDAWR